MFPSITDSSFQSHIVVQNPSFGQSPSGFKRMHIELRPKEAIRLIGYDPRSLEIKSTRGKTRKANIPANVSEEIVGLQNTVQRSIDTSRVGQMTDYLAGPFERAEFADWDAITLVTSTEPELHSGAADDGIASRGLSVWLDPNAEYFIADGQHRYAALLDFVKKYPHYSDRFTQGLTILIIPEHKLVEWAGQAFHDRNYFAVQVRAGKALSVDTRDEVNTLAKQLAKHPEIERAGGIAYERDTLLAGDARFTTHSVLHRFVRAFLVGRSGVDKSTDVAATQEGKEAVWEYISALSLILPWFGAEREEFLTRSSVVLTALAVVGHDLYFAEPARMTEDIVKRIHKLAAIDWRRANLGLVGVVGSEKPVKDKDGNITGSIVQPASSRQAIDSTIRFLRERMGLLVPSN